MTNEVAQRFCGLSENFVVNTGQKWPETDLTWSVFNNFPKDVAESALKVWAEVSNLKLTYANNPLSADLAFSFQDRVHGDGHPFDGEGGRLAHGFLPVFDFDYGLEGEAHFDNEEQWGDRFDLQRVAVHEAGHLFGLSHSLVEGSVMYPYYYRMDRELGQDDILGIQSLYGAPPVRGLIPPPMVGNDGILLMADAMYPMYDRNKKTHVIPVRWEEKFARQFAVHEFFEDTGERV